MALKIRLRQQGRTNHACYRLVVTDSRTRRDGRYVEVLGWYDPHIAEEEKSLSIKEDRIQFWIDQGAQMTEKAEALVARSAPKIIKECKEKEELKKAKLRAKKKERKAAAAKKG